MIMHLAFSITARHPRLSLHELQSLSIMSTEPDRHGGGGGGGNEASAASAPSGVSGDAPSAPDSSLGKKRKASDAAGEGGVDTSVAGVAPMGGKKSQKKTWTVDEDQQLLVAIHEAREVREEGKEDSSDDTKEHEDEDTDADEEDDDWDEIAKAVPGRTAVQCLQRYMKHLAKKRKVSVSNICCFAFYLAYTFCIFAFTDIFIPEHILCFPITVLSW